MRALRRGGSQQGQSSHVVVHGPLARELLHISKNFATNLFGGVPGRLLKRCFDPLQAVLISPVLAFDNASRHQQQDRTRFKSHRLRVVRDMREETEGQAGRWQLRYPSVVAQERGRVSGIAVAHRANRLVVAADKRWTRADALGRIHDAAVDLERQLYHGLGFIDVVPGEQLGSGFPERVLGGGHDRLVLPMPARDVQQAEQNQMGGDADEIIEVPAATLTNVDGSNVSARDTRHRDGRHFR